ncbi:hypothetical protein PV08_10327 [Exophiala spinifera]|uniref:VOC domain-containing protein n=1 Tax=Exophiala spinifera TaxID=91928 RepID=A0A0D2AWG5_9EURO|nr:uncharacterized protein PV08_10327 [Exophiala spinifera]KIW11028.1 hypothetical protein PV08_10327 [Exophiala spinifera]
MAAQWTPPPNGHPCWINIFATDVQRARTFYKTVFDWDFRCESTGEEEDPTEVAHFSFGDTCPGGGITRVDQVAQTRGKGGVVLYLSVDNLETAMEVRLRVKFAISVKADLVDSALSPEMPRSNNMTHHEELLTDVP